MSPLFALTLLNAGGAVARGLSRVRVPSGRPSAGGGHAAGEAAGRLVPHGYFAPHVPGPDSLSLVWPWLVAVLAVAVSIGIAVGAFYFVEMAAFYSAFFQKPQHAARARRRARAAGVLTLVVASLALWLVYPAWKGWLDRNGAEYAVAEAEGAAARAMAEAESNAGRADKAVAALDHALALDPERRHLYAPRAVAHNLRKDYDRCLVDLAAAIDHEPGEKKYLKYRAKLLTRLGRHAEAAADYARLHELDPSLLALCIWTESLRKAGQVEAADREGAAGIPRFLDATPDSGDKPDSLLITAAIKWNHAERVAPRVERWVAEAGAEPEKRSNALDQRAKLRFARKDYAGAIADWGEVIALQPEWWRSAARARVCVRLKDYRAAVRELHEGIKRHADDWESRIELAWLMATCPDDTIRDARAAREHAAAGLAGLKKQFDDWDKADTEALESSRKFNESLRKSVPGGKMRPFEFPEEPANPPLPPEDSSGAAECHIRLLTAAVEAESGNLPEARRLLAEMRKSPPTPDGVNLYWLQRYEVLAKAIDAGRPVRDPAE